MKLITRRSIDQFLFLYGVTISAALFFGALASLEDSANLTTFVLFLPVSLYFAIEVYRKLYRYILVFLNLDQPRANRYFHFFDLSTFFDQGEITFLATMILFALAISLSLFRLSQNLLP